MELLSNFVKETQKYLFIHFIYPYSQYACRNHYKAYQKKNHQLDSPEKKNEKYINLFKSYPTNKSVHYYNRKL